MPADLPSCPVCWAFSIQRGNSKKYQPDSLDMTGELKKSNPRQSYKYWKRGSLPAPLQLNHAQLVFADSTRLLETANNNPTSIYYDDCVIGDWTSDRSRTLYGYPPFRSLKGSWFKEKSTSG